MIIRKNTIGNNSAVAYEQRLIPAYTGAYKPSSADNQGDVRLAIPEK
ncbi:hypothetical protein ACL9RF_16105 [Sphingobacterium sp. Mn56C]